MSPVIWENCRRKDDGSINLVAAAVQTGLRVTPTMRAYLEMVEEIRRINSRQLAAATIVAAHAYASSDAAHDADKA